MKIGLMEQAHALTSAPPTGGLPQRQFTGLDTATGIARRLALGEGEFHGQGVGSYQPYLDRGNALTSVGTGAIGEGRVGLAQQQARGQQAITGAQSALAQQQALGQRALGGVGYGQDMIQRGQQMGLGYLGGAGQAQQFTEQGVRPGEHLSMMGGFEGMRGADIAMGGAQQFNPMGQGGFFRPPGRQWKAPRR